MEKGRVDLVGDVLERVEVAEAAGGASSERRCSIVAAEDDIEFRAVVAASVSGGRRRRLHADLRGLEFRDGGR